MDDGIVEQLDRLESAVLADPGTDGFAALAELYRRSGRVADAEAVVRAGLSVKPDAWEGRVALALALLDRGLDVEARSQLERVVNEAAWLHDIALAEPGPAPTLADADFQADEDASFPSDDEPEPLEQTHTSDLSIEGDRVPGAFATETMAGLLERQGDSAGAARIRASIDAPLDVIADEPEAPEAHIIVELERWLVNAQRRMGERA